MDVKFLGDRPYAVTSNGDGVIYLLDVEKRVFPGGACLAAHAAGMEGRGF